MDIEISKVRRPPHEVMGDLIEQAIEKFVEAAKSQSQAAYIAGARGLVAPTSYQLETAGLTLAVLTTLVNGMAWPDASVDLLRRLVLVATVEIKNRPNAIELEPLRELTDALLDAQEHRPGDVAEPTAEA